MNPLNRVPRGIYAITDISPETTEASIVNAVEQAILGGAALVQYRDKLNQPKQRASLAMALQNKCSHLGIPLIINDDIELAKACGAAGVHLGRHDPQIDTARHMLGTNTIIGVSCYNQLDAAKRAQTAGADYIAFGSIFASKTKPDAVSASLSLVHEAKKSLSIPICAIGGIDISNAKEVAAAGADLLAVISDIFKAIDIKSATQQLTDVYQQAQTDALAHSRQPLKTCL